MSAAKFVLRVGSALAKEPVYYVTGDVKDTHWTPVQSAAHRFDDAEQVRAAIKTLAAHAWSSSMRPVRLFGAKTIRRERP